MKTVFEHESRITYHTNVDPRIPAAARDSMAVGVTCTVTNTALRYIRILWLHHLQRDALFQMQETPVQLPPPQDMTFPKVTNLIEIGTPPLFFNQ